MVLSVCVELLFWVRLCELGGYKAEFLLVLVFWVSFCWLRFLGFVFSIFGFTCLSIIEFGKFGLIWKFDSFGFGF